MIDRLDYNNDGGYEVHDYKTSGSLPSQDYLDNNRQLALYQIGVKEAYKDAKDIRLIWHYLVFDKEFISSCSDAQLEDLKKQVVSLIKTIEQYTIYEPREGRLCDWCYFYEYCPAKKHEVKVSALPAKQYRADRGVSLVNEYASMKESIAELQAELGNIEKKAIEYAKQEDISNIAGDKYILKIEEVESLKFPGSGEDDREEF